MKQVTYHIRGRLDNEAAPAVMAACAAVPGVRRVHISGTEEMDAVLTLIMTDAPMEMQEKILSEILEARGVALMIETRTVTDEDSAATRTKRERTVRTAAAVSAMVLAVVLSVLLTFSLTTSYLRKNPPPTADVGGGSADTSAPTVFEKMEFLDRLFRDLSILELDENFEANILKSYVAATGDIYAEYFTDEELEALMGNQNGEMCGIGMQVVNDICTVGGIDYQAVIIVNVYKDSPAEKAGVLPGDCIMYVGVGEERALVHEIGYTEAHTRMSGEEGTACEFVVYRMNPETGLYDELEFSAIREKMTTRSVTGRVYGPDATVGVIRITGFDNTTAPQFEETVEQLRAVGCTSFVLDLRGNPGGLLTSVEDVLTFFLNENDVMISTKDNRGNESVTKLIVSKDGHVMVGSRTLTAEDVGKYRDLNFSVLVSGYSASAAELFTANMRDYKLAPIVGEKTFGKGSMQSTVLLSNYGYEGALKLTVAYYYPPCGEGYDGMGITPDVEVALDEAYKFTNLNLLTDEQDNQLAAAVKALTPAS